MKPNLGMKGLYCCILFVVTSSVAFGQSGNFRSRISGEWHTPATWERDVDGNGTFGDPGDEAISSVAPTSASGTILIRHTVTVSQTVVIDQTSIGNSTLSGTLLVNADLTVNNGSGSDIIFGSGFGTYRLDVNSGGRLIVQDGATLSGATTGKLRIMSGGFYRHNYATTGGQIYDAAWQTGSTLEFTGYTSNTDTPLNLDQSFQNIIWNCPAQEGFIDLGLVGSSTTVNGNFNVQQTNGAFLIFSQNDNYSLTIGGDMNISGDSKVAFNGFTNITSQITVTGSLNYSSTNESWVSVEGQTILTIDGNLSLSAGTLDLVNGGDGSAPTGSTEISLDGDFTFTGGTLSNSANAAGCLISFDNNTEFTDGGTVTGPVNFRVTRTLDLLGESALTGSGSLTVGSLGILRLGSTNPQGALQLGVSGGNIQLSGARNYTGNSTIVYSGTTGAQYIGDGFPSAGGNVNLTIENNSGVNLSDDLEIVALRTLTLTTGNLIIGTQTLTINGTVSGNGGIVGGPTSNLNIGGDGNFGTLTFAGTNQLLNFTVDRGTSGVVTLGDDLTILGLFTHSDGTVDFSGTTLTISGAFTNAGGLLAGDDLATLAITGSAPITGDIPLTGAIGTFTLDHSTGATVSSIQVSSRLNLISGVLTGNVSFPVQSPDQTEVLHRRNGSLGTSNALTASLYNITYSNSTNILTGEELVAGALNNLTLAGSGTLTLSENLDVNGYFRQNSGTFNSGGRSISIAGDYIKDGGNSIFTGTTVTFDGTSILLGEVAVSFANVAVAPNSSLDLGEVALNISGDFTVNALGTMTGGSGTTTFNGTSTILIPNATTTPRFHNVTIDDNSSLTISCSDCGTTGNRPAIEFTGNWNSNKTGAVFSPAANTSVRLAGTANQNIAVREDAPHSFWNLEIGGSNSATLTTTLRVLNDLSLEGTKVLSTGASNKTIYVGRHFIFDGGSFTAGLGNVVFNGNGVQSIRRTSGSGSPIFHNITLEQAGGNFSVETDISLRNIFTISGNSASVDFDGGTTTTGTAVVTLLSTEAQTASIAAIPNPSVVYGSITAQRFMSGNEGKIYRYIASPVTGARVADLQGEIPVTGSFTGTSWTAPTDCAGCMPCTGCVNNNQTMFRLNEAITGVALNYRYEDFPQTTNTETFQAGRGYAVWVREGVNPTTWNLRGTVTKGQQTLPVTYSGSTSDDGWNLVGNPYPSTIDWFLADGASSWTRTNIDPTIYLWDEDIQNYATYNRSVGAGGTGTFGGSRYIAAGQAFWIKATGSGPALVTREGVKANQPTTEFLRIATETNAMRMTLLVEGKQRDQAVIVSNVEGATDSYDQSLDSYKFYGPVNLYTFTEDEKALAINALGGMGCSKEIQMGFSGATPGVYAIQFSEFDSFAQEADLYLVDKFTGESFALASESPLYEFQVTDDSASFNMHRFSLLFSKAPIDTKLLTQTQDVCVGMDAKVEVMGSQQEMGYYVTLDGTTISEEVMGNGGSISLVIPQDKISTGENILMIMAKPVGCAAIPLENSVNLTKEPIPSISKVESGISCNGSPVSLKAFGAPSNAVYNWYESADATEAIAGQNSEVLNITDLNKSKTYFVSITSALGCESERIEVKAEVNIFEEAAIAVTDDKLVSNHGSGNQWYLDGNKIEGATGSEYKPLESGVYKLDVTIGMCVSSSEVDFLVTSVDDPNLVGVDIYPNPTTSGIRIHVNSSNEVKVNMYNSLGVKVISGMALMPSGANSRAAEIDLTNGASGFYLIEILDGEKIKRKKILKK